MAQIQQSSFENIGVNKTSGFQGNIIPTSWRTKITTESGRHDLNASWIFSEIVFWYRPDREGRPKFKDDIWQTSYRHFTKKFGYDSERTRRLLVRLEKLGLIRREFRTIEKCGQQYSNVLFIRLLANIASDGSIISDFGANIYDDRLYNNDANQNYDNVCPKMNSGDLVLSSFPETNSGFDNKISSSSAEKKVSFNEVTDLTSESLEKMYLPMYKFATPYPPIRGEHIDIENKRENKERRSDQRKGALSISSFSSLDEESVCFNKISDPICEKNKENLKTEYNPGIFSEISKKAKQLFGSLGNKKRKSIPLDWEEGRGLSELSGISEEDRDILNKRSVREFSLNFINQLILKLGIKYPEHRFFRREQFMNYMVKALMNEILQAPQANNEDFKFACLPKTEEEQYLKQVHKYLDEIESSINTTPEMTLKKKILGRLDPKIAYEILSGTSLSVRRIEEMDDNDIKLMELEIKILRPLKIDQQKGREIPDWIQQILFEEVRGIYGESVCRKVVKTPSETNNYWSSKQRQQQNTDTEILEMEPSLSNSIWDQVRKALRKTYGLAADNAWFKKLQILDSELDLQESNEQNCIQTTIKLAAPTSFIRDWVSTNYLPVIEKEMKIIYPEFKYIELVC